MEEIFWKKAETNGNYANNNKSKWLRTCITSKSFGINLIFRLITTVGDVEVSFCFLFFFSFFVLFIMSASETIGIPFECFMNDSCSVSCCVWNIECTLLPSWFFTFGKIVQMKHTIELDVEVYCKFHWPIEWLIASQVNGTYLVSKNFNRHLVNMIISIYA